MINITPTFLFELSNTAKGIPEGNDTNLKVAHLKPNDTNPKDIKFEYKDVPYLPNPRGGKARPRFSLFHGHYVRFFTRPLK